MILFERIFLPISAVSISIYIVIVIPLSFAVFLDLLRKKRFLLPKHTMPFLVTYVALMFLGLQGRNINVLIGRFLLFFAFLITYNLLIDIKFDNKIKLKLSFIIAILLFISTTTMLTDYFHITKFLKYLNLDSYHDFLKVGRPSSILGAETNFTSARLGALLPFLFYYILNEKKHTLKFSFVLFTLLLTVIAQILTGSRMGYITLLLTILVIIYLIFTKFNVKTILITILILVILSAIGVQVIKYELNNSSLSWRMRNVENFVKQKGDFSKGENSIAVRFILFVAGLDMIKNHPVFGVGLGNSRYETLKYINEGYGMRYLHNTFLGLGAENGLIPLILFLILYFHIIVKAIRLSSKDNFWLFLALSMVIQFINFFFLSDILNRVFWVILLPIGNLALLQKIDKQ